MSVEYILADHLGSASITTNTDGDKTSEVHYTPWGEVLDSWSASASLPIEYTFTGQMSYMDDPITSETTEGFGLMFFNARWMDPQLGRFAQADSIVPPGVQGLDRYAYANNSPLVYTDPSGHESVCGSIYSDPECNGEPDQLDESLLHKTPRTRTGVSGMDYYNWYKELWYKQNGSFTVWDFIALIIYVELDNVGNPAIPNMYDGYESYREGAVRAAYQWCKEQMCDASIPEGALNWIAAYSYSAASRYFGSRTFESTNNPIESATLIANSIRDPIKFGEAIWASGWASDRPYGFGNESLYSDRALTVAANWNMIAWRSGFATGDEVIIPTGCGSYILHGEKDNYENVECGNGKWPLR
jgi:RHS repeat-associated protein